jgi:NADPH-ferrihemoprotein reductase
MYSISCAPSPAGAPARAEFAFSLVTVPTPAGPRRGVATGWLARLLARHLPAEAAAAAGVASAASASIEDAADAAPRVPVFLRPSDNFGLPKDASAPLVMVGPGTGVAPFRGFLQQRAAEAAAAAAGTGRPGEAWLYFGCRRREEDYIYGPELEAFEADGTLTKLRVAFSRAGGDAANGAANGGSVAGGGKTYVQHLMAADGAALGPLLARSDTRVFVCGDGAAMARDVHAALAGLLAQQGGLGAAGAEARLKEMAAAGRYVRDLWAP